MIYGFWCCEMGQMHHIRLSDNGGVMVGMVSRVKEVVVQCPMQPVIQELHWTSMNQKYPDHPICPPPGEMLSCLIKQGHRIEHKPTQYNLVIPFCNGRVKSTFDCAPSSTAVKINARREENHLVVPKPCPRPLSENPRFASHFSSTGQLSSPT